MISIFKKRWFTRVCPKVSGLAAWEQELQMVYSSLPLAAVVSLFCKSV
jgi:hypothetical protein